MILTDYLRFPKDITWDYAKQCGVEHGVIRLPETPDFDITNFSHWKTIHETFVGFGIKPMVIEPIPNELHDHIKAGDELRDRSIQKLITMLAYMDKLDIRTLCFNFMAHIGWLRTDNQIIERGGALVTGFDANDFPSHQYEISESELWDNYFYFIKKIIPYAEKYNIRLALHPDDPPVDRIGNVSRIMTSCENIRKAIETVPSEMLGITMCQATYKLMGVDLFEIIPQFKDKIFFVHFRNVRGNKNCFHETFHDNGEIDMAMTVKTYVALGIDQPVRVDHVPLMAGECAPNQGYTPIGRLFAIGYLKGLLEMSRY